MRTAIKNKNCKIIKTRYLGVIFDYYSIWNSHVYNVIAIPHHNEQVGQTLENGFVYNNIFLRILM